MKKRSYFISDLTFRDHYLVLVLATIRNLPFSLEKKHFEGDAGSIVGRYPTLSNTSKIKVAFTPIKLT